MTEITRELMYGKHPVRRTDPKPGQSEWYYLDPRGTDSVSDMKEIDVESENSPNPYANEIQNYLYKNDEYNYKQLYGDTPPPMSNKEALSRGLNNQLNFSTNTKGNIPNYGHSVSQDAIFNRVFNKTLKEEGGYENRATHIDAPTNMGFQQATLDRFKSAHPNLAHGYPDNIRDLTYKQGKQIARKDYFDKYRISEIQSQPLQETMFDSFFNHSPQAPAYWAQKAINQNTNMHIDEDGVFGSQTIRALNNLSPEEINKVNNAILDMRQADYEHELKTNTNPNYGSYTTGLPNRFNRFR